MSGPFPPDEELTETERALSDHMELLRASPPAPQGTLVTRVIRSARLQQAVRRPLIAVGAVAAAVLDAIRLLFSGKSRS